MPQPQRAHVTSVDAIEAFRVQLINYVSKARPTLEEVSGDVMRTKLWLENEQRMHWEGQVRRRTKDLEEAQQALFSANIANLREESSAEQHAYHRARRALNDAQEKLRILKIWNREFDGTVGPLVKQMEKLHTILANDLTQAIVFLGEVIRTLDTYAGIQPSASLDAAAEPAKVEGQGTEGTT